MRVERDLELEKQIRALERPFKDRNVILDTCGCDFLVIGCGRHPAWRFTVGWRLADCSLAATWDSRWPASWRRVEVLERLLTVANMLRVDSATGMASPTQG